MLKHLAVIITLLFWSFHSMSAEVTDEDIKKAEKQWKSEKRAMEKHNAKRSNPEYEKVTDQKKIEALNKAAGTPDGTDWFKEKGQNNYRISDEPHKLTKEYRNADEATKQLVDKSVKEQKDRKESHAPNPNQEAIEILEREMDPNNPRFVKEDEYEKQMIQERAQKIADKREAQEKAQKAELEKKQAAERAKQEAARKAAEEKASRERIERDRPRNDGHHRDFDSERRDIHDKMDRGEPIDGDRFDRAKEILDTTV